MNSNSNQIPEADYQRILEDGKNEGKLAAAKVLLEIGTDIGMIAITTGLSELEVLVLKDRYQEV